MARQKKASKPCIEIIKQITTTHQRLFIDLYLTDSTEIEAIIHQIICGKPHHKPIKLYQYLLESFILSGGGDLSNQKYYANQKYKPTFNRIKKAVKGAQCPKLASFETFRGCGYRKTTNTCHEPAFLKTCPLPTFDMKRGALNRMAFSLFFFLLVSVRGTFPPLSGSTLGKGRSLVEPSTSGSTISSGRSPPLPTSVRSSPRWRWRGFF